MSKPEFALDSTKKFIKFINENMHVTDEIQLNREDDVALQELWMGDNMHERSIPLDLILENHVPAPNIRIIVDERGYFPNGGVIHSEVLFFPNALDIFPKYADDLKPTNEIVPLGIVRSIDRGHEIIWHMNANVRLNVFAITGSPVLLDGELTSLQPEMAETLGAAAVSVLHTWYGIQIALLHPQIKEVFSSNGKLEPKTSNNNNLPPKQRVTHYVKKHYKKGKVAKVVKHCKQRKTLCWWVIGHWREYRNGTRIFVKGYWKGPLREAKRNLDDTRIRRINT